MRIKIGDEGLIRGLFLLALVVAIAFVGISFGKPYYRYIVLDSHTRDILKEEIGNVNVIKEKIMGDARELNVPLQEDNLNVRIENKMVKVDAHWSEVVDFWGYYRKKLDFAIHEEY
jgi:hypothetical protein